MSASIDEIHREYSAVRRQFRVILLSALSLLLVGATVYRHLMHLSWVNAFYFCTVTLTTVGYGDITPTTDAAKIFTIFYLLVGIGIIATFANLLVKNASLRREIRRSKRKK